VNLRAPVKKEEEVLLFRTQVVWLADNIHSKVMTEIDEFEGKNPAESMEFEAELVTESRILGDPKDSDPAWNRKSRDLMEDLEEKEYFEEENSKWKQNRVA
jgi:hypothetical protein